jgi:uncharacterized membrane protein
VAPLAVLVAVTLLARLTGQFGVVRLRDWTASIRIGLAVMFVFTAAAHFNSMRADLVAMVPPVVPNPELMVTFTGICEVAGAVGILLPRTRRIAALALIAMLLAVLPANIHAARADLTIGGAAATPMVPRIALQMLFMALLWWSGVRPSRGETSGVAPRGSRRSTAGRH